MPLPSPQSVLSNITHSITNAMSSTFSADAEEKSFREEVKAVEQWWTDSRWRYTKRPFTAEQIVTKMGTIKPQYANNAMSKKLWAILEGRFTVRLG